MPEQRTNRKDAPSREDRKGFSGKGPCQDAKIIRDEGRTKILSLINLGLNPVEISKKMDEWSATHLNPTAAKHVSDMQKTARILKSLKDRADQGDKEAKNEVDRLVDFGASLKGEAKANHDRMCKEALGGNYATVYGIHQPAPEVLQLPKDQYSGDQNSKTYSDSIVSVQLMNSDTFDQNSSGSSSQSGADLSSFVFMRDNDLKANGNARSGQTSIEKATYERAIEIEQPKPTQSDSGNSPNIQQPGQRQEAAMTSTGLSAGLGLFGKYLFENTQLMLLREPKRPGNELKARAVKAVSPALSDGLPVQKQAAVRLAFGNLPFAKGPDPNSAQQTKQESKPEQSSLKIAKPAKQKKAKRTRKEKPQNIQNASKERDLKARKARKIKYKTNPRSPFREQRANRIPNAIKKSEIPQVPKKDVKPKATSISGAEITKTKAKTPKKYEGTKTKIGQVSELIKSFGPRPSKRSPAKISKKVVTDKEKEKAKLKNILMLILSKKRSKARNRK